MPYAKKILIGLMSGTSVDAIDGVLVKLQLGETQPIQFEMLDTHSAHYPKKRQEQIKALISGQTLSAETFCEINFEIAECFAQVANVLIQNNPKITVDAIASHGQTVWHIPPNANQKGSTLQLGPPSVIQALTGIPTIGDFRSADMALGGQGAPLVPFADQLLFQNPQQAVAVQNLGGIGNITVLPKTGDTHPIFAFDTGPANALMDCITQRYFNQAYDRNAELAQQGQVIEPLLLAWLEDPYFQQTPPKSTGKEKFNWAFIESGLNAIHLNDFEPHDLLRTALALTEESILKALEQFVLPKVPIQQLILGGGGTNNPLLMAGFKQRLNPMGIELKTHADYGISNQYKEALAFAILGYAKLNNIPSNIATGASSKIALGCIA